MQSLLDDLVRDVWSVEITRIDVCDAGGDHLTQKSDGGIAIGRRAEDARSRQLHRTIPHASHRQIRGHRECPARKCL